jgi:hypothetical protein
MTYSTAGARRRRVPGPREHAIVGLLRVRLYGTARGLVHRRTAWLLLTGLGLILWVAYIAHPTALDAHAYYVGQYGTLGGTDAYLYSPAFSQAVEPLRWLGWDGFRTVWRAINVAALAVMAGPLTGPLIFIRPVAFEVNLGNIHLLMGLAVVAGFRWPATWAFILLTKVTPGVGLLWFAVRREWRNLGIALGVTAAIVAVSFVVDPAAWFQWFAVLRSPGETDALLLVSAPLEWRLLAAAALVTWGARTDRHWTVLGAAFLALPAVWLAASATLVAALHGRPRADALDPVDGQPILLEVGGRQGAAVRDDDVLVTARPEHIGVPAVLRGRV